MRTPPSPSAVSLRTKGIDQFTAGDFEGARESLAQSWEMVPSDRTLAYLILAETELGMCEIAYKRAVFLNVQRLDEALAAYVRSRFSPTGPCPTKDGAEPPVGTKQRCDLTLRVESTPPDAEVWGFIPGESMGQIYFGRTPLLLENLCPGERQLTLKKFGFRPNGRLVKVGEGEPTIVTFTLEEYPRAQFLDRFRKYARLGPGVEWVSGETEEGNSFSFQSSPAVQGHLAVSIWNFWFYGSLGYLPLRLSDGQELDVVEARGILEYVLPIHRMLPFPTMNSTVLSANIGAGVVAMALDRWGGGALVKGGFSLFWLSPALFYYLGTSLGHESGVSSMWGVSIDVDLFL